jgi:hypothetical protein
MATATAVSLFGPSGARVRGGYYGPGAAGALSGSLTASDAVAGGSLTGALSPPPTGAVPQFLTHDGGTVTSGSVGNFGGPTDTLWHRRLGKAWARIYAPGNALQGLGNWLDSTQASEGASPFASTGTATAVDQVLTATVTTLVQRWLTNGLNRGFYLSSRAAASAWPIDFYGRGDATAGNRPKLTVVTSTGTTVLTAKANACWNKTSFAGVSATVAWRLSAQQQPAILRFDLSGITGTLTSATLAFKVKAFDTGHTGHVIDVFEADPPALVLPEDVAAPLLGIAAEYADFNTMKAAVGTDARLKFADDFQSPGWADTGFTPAAPRVLNPATGTYYAVGEITGGGPPGSGTGSANVRYDVSAGVNPNGTISPVLPELFGQYWLYLENDFGTTSDDAVKIPAMGVQFGWWNPVGYWQSTTGNGGYPGTGLKVYPATDAQALLNDKFEYQGHSVRLLTGTAPLPGDDDPYDGYFGIYIYPYNLDQAGPFPASPAFPNIVIRKAAWYCFDIRVKQNSMSGSQDSLGNYAVANPDGVWQCWINGLAAYSNTTYRWRRHADFGVQGMWIDVYHGGQSPQPVTAHYRVDRVSLATAYIGPPVTLPTWVPPPGEVAVLSTANGLLTNRLDDVTAPYYAAFYTNNVINGDSGTVLNPHWGPYGAIVCHGTGHSSGNDNMVAIAELNSASVTFKRLSNPAPIFGAGTDGLTQARNAGYDEPAGYIASINDYGEYDGAFTPGGFNNNGGLVASEEPAGPHSYGALDIIGPAEGGAACGTLCTVVVAAPGHKGEVTPAPPGRSGSGAHVMPFATSTGSTGSYRWARDGNAQSPARPTGGPVWTQFVAAQNRIYIEAKNATASAPVQWFDRVSKTYVQGTGTQALKNSDNPYTGTMFDVPARNLLILADRFGGNLRIQYARVGVADTDPSWQVATISPALPVVAGFTSADWCVHNGRIIVLGASADTDGSGNIVAVHEVQIPATLTDAWSVVRAAFGAGQSIQLPMNSDPFRGSPSYKKWSYDEKARCFPYFPTARRSDQGAEVIYAYRPRGT